MGEKEGASWLDGDEKGFLGVAPSEAMDDWAVRPSDAPLGDGESGDETKAACSVAAADGVSVNLLLSLATLGPGSADVREKRAEALRAPWLE